MGRRPKYAGPSRAPAGEPEEAEEDTEEDEDELPDRRPGVRRRISTCDICKGLFPVDGLVDFGGGYVCEDCLERKPDLLEKTAVKLKKAPSGPEGKGARSIESDRGVKDAYLHKRTYIDAYEKRRGRAPSSTTLMWPKCYRHPDRSTKDRCRSCGKPICAMCVKRRGDLIYCPDCHHRSSRVLKKPSSGKYSGFSGSFFEAVRESIFQPGAFFRNLPSSGSVIGPVLFSLLAWIPGSIIAIALLWFFGFRKDAFEFATFADEVLKPTVLGGMVAGAILATAGWLPVHLLASLMGGSGSTNKSVRMFSLASAFHYLFIVPFIGWPIGVLASFITVPRAIAETHEIGIISSFLVYTIFLAGVVGFYFGAAAFIFSEIPF
jgi:hypothetical protein